MDRETEAAGLRGERGLAGWTAKARPACQRPGPALPCRGCLHPGQHLRRGHASGADLPALPWRGRPV